MSDTNPSFHLTDAQRANLIGGIDADALERFIRLMRPEHAEALLASFTKAATGAGMLVGLWGDHNAEAAAALEEVWAPTWEEWGLDAIENETFQLPGRAIARARLKAKGDHRQSPGSGSAR